MSACQDPIDLAAEVPATAAPRRSRRGLLASLSFAAAATCAAWFASGSYFTDRGLGAVADRWAELEECLLGPRSAADPLPSERWRRIALGYRDVGPGAWPARCLPYAAALDAALSRPGVADALGIAPAFARLVADLPARSGQLDELWGSLEAADLPAPRARRVVPAAPPPTRPLLRATALEPLGRGNLVAASVSLDPVRGEILRLLMPDRTTRVCRLEGAGAARWSAAVCRDLPLDTASVADARLAPSEPGGADLVYHRDRLGRDGFFDGSSGRRLWRPRSPRAQALVGASGHTTLLYAELTGADRHVDAWRVVQLAVGRVPASRRLPIPNTASALLLPGTVVWWQPAGDHLELRSARLSPQATIEDERRLGDLPPGSEHVADCATTELRALLFRVRRGAARYTVVLERRGRLTPPMTVEGEGSATLGCQGDAALVTRHGSTGLTLVRCLATGCNTYPGNAPLPLADTVVAAPLGDGVAIAWLDGQGIVRLRTTHAGLDQAVERVLLDPIDGAGPRPRSLRLVTSGSTGLLLVQSTMDQLYAIRLDLEGATPVRPTDR